MARYRKVSIKIVLGVFGLLALSFVTAFALKSFLEWRGSSEASREPASARSFLNGRGELEASQILMRTAIDGVRARYTVVDRSFLDRLPAQNRNIQIQLFQDTNLILNVDPLSVYDVNDGVEGTLFTGVIEGDPASKFRFQITRNSTMSGEIVAFGREYRILPAETGLHLIVEKKSTR